MTTSTPTSTVLENIKRATQGTIDALNAWDYDALVALRTSDFVFQALPTSLQQPAHDNEHFARVWFDRLTPAFKNFKISPRMSMHDPESRRSVVYNTVSAETAGGPKNWELVMMISFDAAGEKITRIDEFFDSKVYLDMMASMS